MHRRLDSDPSLCVLGLRFKGDFMCPSDRFDGLRDEFGERFVAVEIPGRKLSVLTQHLTDRPGHPTRDALDRVLDLFRRQLLPERPAEGEDVSPGS